LKLNIAENIENIKEENAFLTKEIQELEKELRKSEYDGVNYVVQAEETFNSSNFLRNQSKNTKEHSMLNQRQLDEVTYALAKIQAKYDENSFNNEKLKNEITNIKSLNQKESFKKSEREERNKELDSLISLRENELRNYMYALEDNRNQKDRFEYEKKNILIELEKLTSHISNLKENNKTVHTYFINYILFFR